MTQQSCITLDGVTYVICTIANRVWRIGSLGADWPGVVARQQAAPDQTVLQSWAEQGIFAAPADIPFSSLCVMCCGLGSAWPGMGRALYDEFPIARAAMDQIAALADWDILALLDVTEQDRINQTRWQIPYLFLLEYAQWRLFHTLGLSPTVICGHSLGELIALCFAGVYSLESAWQLLETRAIHMAELESAGAKEGGMLAVPTTFDIIAKVLNNWPDLRISNRNTERQFILSGPREDLLQARRQLRKDHIPALMLNMDLAFHNPAMRILRTISQRRLNGLMMHSPSFTMLSCVDAHRYPAGKEAISTRIADLDENTVDWVRLMHTIQKEYPCKDFLELGPQETLCGITSELLPSAICIPADKKGHEALAIRTACARLFSLSLLDFTAIQHQSRISRPQPLPQRPHAPNATPVMPQVDSEEEKEIIKILAQASSREPGEIKLEMDLRQDLGLRSSNFPFLMLEAEKVLTRPVVLENLFQITTVADAILFLTGNAPAREQPKVQFGLPSVRFLERRAPVRRYDEKMRPQPIDLCAHGIAWHQCGKILVDIQDRDVWPQIGFGLLSQGSILDTIQSGYGELAERLWAGFFASEQCKLTDDPAPLKDHAGLLILAEPWTKDQPKWEMSHDVFAHDWLCIVRRFIINDEETEWRGVVYSWFREVAGRANGVRHRAIAWIASADSGQILLDCADLLVLELEHGEGQNIIWHRGIEQRYCPNSVIFESVRPDLNPPKPEDGNLFQSLRDFSSFVDAGILQDGGTIPLSRILSAMSDAAAVPLPWLRITGMTDVRFRNLPQIQPGITRQCRVASRARLVLPYDGVMTRICDVELSVASLDADGRHNGSWEEVGRGNCLLAARPGDFPQLWNSSSNGEMVADKAAIRQFCVKMRLAPQLGGISSLGEGGIYEGAILPYQSNYLDGVWLTLDALIQGARWTLASLDFNPKLKLHGIGFIRFMEPYLPYRNDLRWQWNISWHDSKLTRFDAQLLAGADQLLATIHNLEFV